MTKWISVEDRLPELPAVVFTVDSRGRVRMARYSLTLMCWKRTDGRHAGQDVTHWLVIDWPDPPEETADG